MKGDFSRWTFRPEKHYHSVLKQQGRVSLDSDWNEAEAIARHRIETETIDVIGGCGAPIGNAGFVINGGKELTISKGRAYVSGLMCVNEQDDLPIAKQPDLPGFKLPDKAGLYVAYLKVWLRHITALDDPSIREDALGGPDTCTRSRVIWQVNLLQPGKLASLDCNTSFNEWDALTAGSTGMLAARAEPDPTSADPCLIPAKAGYRRLENQLYRVEIHDPGDASGKATFKWSRDNGSVATSWLGQNNLTLTVSSLGRDSELGLNVGQWVELIDDTRELNGQPGTLAKIASVSDNTIILENGSPTGSFNIAEFPLNPKIRRWDSVKSIAVKAATWFTLEDGVQVQFSQGAYATGDYWVIPARTLKADVEWPEDNSGNPIARPPLGIRIHYCKLATVLFDGSSWKVTNICLPLFPPLTSVSASPTTRPGIHVVDVRTLGHSAPFPNDGDVPLAMLADGIAAFCDAPIAPYTISRATCSVSVEIPNLDKDVTNGAQTIVGFNTIVLASSVGLSTDRKVIQWKPGSAAIFELLQRALAALQSAKQEPRLLARFRMNGRFIWGQLDEIQGAVRINREEPSLLRATGRVYLDGEALGIERVESGAVRTSLRLPSGDGAPGGNFETWFWITLPVGILTVTFNPSQVIAGQPTTGAVTLNSPAPGTGAVISLAANNPNIASVPPSITIPSGATTGTFQVTKTQNSAGSAQDMVQVTAAYDQSKVKGGFTIVPRPPA